MKPKSPACSSPGPVSQVAPPSQLTPPFARLLSEVYEYLRAQHPEWIDSDGNCSMCESYKQRLAEQLLRFQAKENSSTMGIVGPEEAGRMGEKVVSGAKSECSSGASAEVDWSGYAGGDFAD